jgi:dephospho-CoA kinase
MGVPVIESYPGAAQDIMGIPRKRASLEYLKDGLGEFGIQGDFLATTVSHDELDAITSAIVGVFFWGGKFEALGNEDEEYLIIPDLLVPPDRWQNRSVVGVSGPIASGKTTGARLLEACGFAYGRYSQVLERVLRQDGIIPSRKALQELGERVHRERGQRWLARRLVMDLPPDQDLTIDGLRFPEDHAFMVETFGPGFLHLHVNAPTELRERRYVADGGTLEEFRNAIQHPVEANIPGLARLAHVVLTNDRSKAQYEDELLRSIGYSVRVGPKTASVR